MTIKQLDNWLRKEGVSATQLAEFLGLTKHAISKWRERKTIPAKALPRIQAIVELDRRSLQRHLRPRTPELFE